MARPASSNGHGHSGYCARAHSSAPQHLRGHAVENIDIARIFEEIADQGENQFRVPERRRLEDACPIDPLALHLRHIEQMETGIVSIGGAGAFDGILLSGIVAVYLS